MKGVPQVVNTLNKLLAGELMAVDQYLAHGEIYSDLGLLRLAEHTLHESEHEREHARERSYNEFCFSRASQIWPRAIQ